MKKARAMQLLRKASSLGLKAMTQPGHYEPKRSYSMLRHSEVSGLVLARRPAGEPDVVGAPRKDAEAHAGEASGLPFSTI